MAARTRPTPATMSNVEPMYTVQKAWNVAGCSNWVIIEVRILKEQVLHNLYGLVLGVCVDSIECINYKVNVTIFLSNLASRPFDS
jgi:hypothetical protein